MKKKRFLINGKFLSARLEGMPRVGREIVLAFDDLLRSAQYSDISIKILAPVGAASKIRLANVEVEEVGYMQGFLWEQLELPYYQGRDYCLHFTATAPVIRKNGCVVVHDAQFISTRQSHSLKSYVLFGSITRIVARRYDRIITVSDYAKKEILLNKVCDRSDIEVIHNGADHVLRRTKDDEILSAHGLTGEKFILSNSYVHHHKNVRLIFEALKDRPDLSRKLVLFGNSSRADYEHRGISVPPGVIFVGRVSDEQLVSLMNAATMFVFPSLTEGFGLPPLEAMALGCPTICASAGAMPETCGQGALFASPYVAGDWTQKIDFLWNNQDARAQLIKSGIETAAKFSWRTAAERYLRLITDRPGIR